VQSPSLWREISIPEVLLTETVIDGIPHRYSGDIRIGSLQKPGSVDFVTYRSADDAPVGFDQSRGDGVGLKPCFIGAFNLEGEPLWEVGAGGTQPSRPGPVAIHDIDGDGHAEIICIFKIEGDAEPDSLSNVVIQIRDGRTGKIKAQSAPPDLTDCSGEGPNWVHQRILIANLRGLDTPRDFVIKLGSVVLAFDQNLKMLWRYTCPWSDYGHCAAYIPSVGDIDSDGHDEINGGYFLLDHDGTILWEKDWAPHMDSVAITEWDDGRTRAICSGHGHVFDEAGNTILSLGEDLVPHGQEVRVARFVEDDPSPQMAIRWNGHNTDIMLVDTRGECINRFSVNESPNNTGMEAVYWNGTDQPALLYNGGMLWDPITGDGIDLQGLPEPDPIGRMGWYHCIPANICGDGREELVLYNPWDPRIFVYTAGNTDDPLVEQYAARPRQYNPRLMD
jgi:hypothetical protein